MPPRPVRDAVAAAKAQRTDRLRAIYMDGGGQLGLYASLLTARTPQDLALRVVTAQRLVAGADASIIEGHASRGGLSARPQQASEHRISARCSSPTT